jgi:hypothetical protein
MLVSEERKPVLAASGPVSTAGSVVETVGVMRPGSRKPSSGTPLGRAVTLINGAPTAAVSPGCACSTSTTHGSLAHLCLGLRWTYCGACRCGWTRRGSLSCRRRRG